MFLKSIVPFLSVVLIVRGAPASNGDDYWQQLIQILGNSGNSQEVAAEELGETRLQRQVGWPAKDVKVGQVGGVAVDQDGSVLVFHRADRVWNSGSFDDNNNMKNAGKPIKEDAILRLDANTGEVLDGFGAERFYYPHGLSVDKNGAIYVTDVGLHQVMRFPKGATEPDLVLGEAKVSGSDTEHFCKPTDVAVLPNGDFFVSDGYCNSRIMKFDKDGKFLTQFGQFGSGESHFHIPHSLSMITDTDVLCVADRENERIQCFSAGVKNSNTTGMFKQSFSNGLGKVYAISYDTVNDVMYLVNEEIGMTIDYEGSILDEWTPSQNKPFRVPHDVDVNPSGTAVYVGEIKPGRLTKFIYNEISG